jgi:hypothetical protein
MPKRKPDILSIDQVVYLLMNGDFSDIELEDSDEEIKENGTGNVSKNEEI